MLTGVSKKLLPVMRRKTESGERQALAKSYRSVRAHLAGFARHFNLFVVSDDSRSDELGPLLSSKTEALRRNRLTEPILRMKSERGGRVDNELCYFWRQFFHKIENRQTICLAQI